MFFPYSYYFKNSNIESVDSVIRDIITVLLEVKLCVCTFDYASFDGLVELTLTIVRTRYLVIKAHSRMAGGPLHKKFAHRDLSDNARNFHLAAIAQGIWETVVPSGVQGRSPDRVWESPRT